jgi:hypothetical protein
MRYENHADVLSKLNGPLWTTLEMTSVDGRQKSHCCKNRENKKLPL